MQKLLINFHNNVSRPGGWHFLKLTWINEGQNVHLSFIGRYGGFCCATLMNFNNADYWSSRRWQLILISHSPSHRIIVRDYTTASYGTWAPLACRSLTQKTVTVYLWPLRSLIIDMMDHDVSRTCRPSALLFY